VTSTYDHRVIQGAESGAFLATMDHLLQGDQGFYELIAESLGLGQAEYRISRPMPAVQPGEVSAGPVAPDML
jgi:2-oxoglutarate decarboxylase